MDTSNKYNRRILMLSGLVGALTLIYAGTLLFDPEQVNTRSASFTWLEAKWTDQADRIELSGAEGDVTLVRKNNIWFVSRDNIEYPAKQVRIEDMLKVISAKGSYLVRGTAAASHASFGLTLDTASRIVIRGGAAAYPLLDLLMGKVSSTGREIYLRKNGADEVRSGEDRLSSYVDSRPSAWFNLRLFPEADHPGLKAESVQRVTVYQDTAEAPLVLTRNEGGWTIPGVTNPDNQRAESYIRAILDAEGEDFLATGDASLTAEGRILLELGNGQTITITVHSSSSADQRSAEVEGSPFRYVLAEWTLTRLFRDGSYFEQQ